ncbi:LRRC15 [Branchiostoma lanceolatum]|uniref:LRRC15 protein n=1 Tax=Branchiostoma lanceolatum TaxID=7740 RepID=A0A8J9WGC9_BRALA|nr:LRRC15 [Branchiostoma lanceolatum]
MHMVTMGSRAAAAAALWCLLAALPCRVARAGPCFPRCSERSWEACIPESLLAHRAGIQITWAAPCVSSEHACFLCDQQSSVPWTPPENVTCFPRRQTDFAVRGYHFGTLSARQLAFVDTRTTSLALIDNSITALEPNALARLPLVMRLHLDFNRLSAIKASWFRGLSELEVLTLSNNQIKTIDPGSFQDANHFRTLFLENNLIQSLRPDWSAGLVSLWDLYLGGNHLDAIPAAAFRGLRQLVRLDLHGNRLSSLDGRVLGELGGLENVKAGGNRLVTLDGRTLENIPWGLTLDLREVSHRSTYRPTVWSRVPYVSLSVQDVLICFHRDETEGLNHLGWMFQAPVIPYCRADYGCRCSALDRVLTKTTVRLPVVIVIPTDGTSRKLSPNGQSLYGRTSESRAGVRLPLKDELSLTLVGVDATDDTTEASVIVIDHTDNRTTNASTQADNTFLLSPNAEKTAETNFTSSAIKTTHTTTQQTRVTTDTEQKASTPHGVASPFETHRTTTQETIFIHTAPSDAPFPLGVLIVIIVALVAMPTLTFLAVLMLRRKCNVVQDPQNAPNSAGDSTRTETVITVCSTWQAPAQRLGVQQSGVSTTTDQDEYRLYWGISDAGEPTIGVSRVTPSPTTPHGRLRPDSSLPHRYRNVPGDSTASSGPGHGGQPGDGAMVSTHLRTRPWSTSGDVHYENTAEGRGNAGRFRTPVDDGVRARGDRTVNESGDNEDHAASVEVSLPRLTRARQNRAVYRVYRLSHVENTDRVLYGREGNLVNTYRNIPCAGAAASPLYDDPRANVNLAV